LLTSVTTNPDAKENAMIPDFKQGDFPDDYYSLIPYVKGAFFLSFLEGIFGE